MLKEKRRGIILNFFTLWAVLVFLCYLAIEHRVLRAIVAAKSWEWILLILSLPTIAVALVVAAWLIVFRSIDFPSRENGG
jgi:hypothetical protein